MDAHLQAQALMLTLGAEIAHRLAHADRSGNGAVRRLEGRHHGIANGLHDGPPFGRDNLLQQPEMLVDEIEGDEVTDALIELSGVLEITEQESQTQDLEALADGERFGPVDVAEGLIGEETLCSENGLASLQEVVQRLVRHPYSRQYATLGAVFQSQAQWPGAQGNGVDRNLNLVEDHGKVLALARLVAADIKELGRMRHRIEHDQRALRQLQRKDGPFSWRQVNSFERDLPQHLLQIGWKIDGRTPEDLAIIFGRGQFVGTVGRDLPHARAYREGHLDQVVERRLIARGTESATILRPIQGLQAFVGGKNTGATWAHDGPCHLENAEPPRIQERRDDPLLVDALLGREIKRVHLVQGMIRGIPHHALEHVHHVIVGRLTQGHKQSLGFVHATMLHERRQSGNPANPSLVRTETPNPRVSNRAPRNDGLDFCRLPLPTHYFSLIGRPIQSLLSQRGRIRATRWLLRPTRSDVWFDALADQQRPPRKRYG